MTCQWVKENPHPPFRVGGQDRDGNGPGRWVDRWVTSHQDKEGTGTYKAWLQGTESSRCREALSES